MHPEGWESPPTSALRCRDLSSAYIACIARTASARYQLMSFSFSPQVVLSFAVQFPFPSHCLDASEPATNLLSGYDLGEQDSIICCPNNRYCLISYDGVPGCCKLESNCGISECGFDEYLCNSTSTLTVTTAAAPESPSVITSTSLSQTCCKRLCATSTDFLCANSQGCCPYGYTCNASDGCGPTPTDNLDGTMTSFTLGDGVNTGAVIPAGCSLTNEFSCPADQGEGCCLVGQVCTIKAGEPVCSSLPADDGLSTSAKAGIGAVVAVAGGVLIACATWAYLARKQKRQKEREAGHWLKGRTAGSDAHDGAGGYHDYDGQERNSTPAKDAGERGSSSGGLASPLAGRLGGGRQEQSSRTTSERSRIAGEQHSVPLLYAQENLYVGPDAVAGPYTLVGVDDFGQLNGRDGRRGGGAEVTISPGGLAQGRDRAIIASDVPQGPDDVVAPVEIDSRSVRQVKDGAERHPVTGARVSTIRQLGSGPIELPAALGGEASAYGEDTDAAASSGDGRTKPPDTIAIAAANPPTQPGDGQYLGLKEGEGRLEAAMPVPQLSQLPSPENEREGPLLLSLGTASRTSPGEFGGNIPGVVSYGVRDRDRDRGRGRGRGREWGRGEGYQKEAGAGEGDLREGNEKERASLQGEDGKGIRM